MPRKREIAYDPLIDPPRRIERRAATTIQALMEAKPHEPIQRSLEELLPLRECLSEAFDQLNERDRWIVNSILIERKSIRNTAADLSLAKSHVDRLYKAALRRLKTILENNPTILEYLND
jgi:DNA-directed RNA polymerase specialized sigma subunit